MRVEIWADIICPWCYIGKARFDHALAAFAHRNQVEVLYRSFELEPGRDKTRVEPVGQMLTDRFGSGGPGMDQQVAELARAEGLDYRTDRHVGSTFDLHRLIHLAREHGLQHQLVAAAFRANFAEARNLFTTSTLAELATETGLKAQDVQRVLNDPSAYAAEVRADEQRAGELEVPGVPFFLIDGRTVISGGQSVDAFTRALERAWTDSPYSADSAAVCSPTASCELPQH